MRIYISIILIFIGLQSFSQQVPNFKSDSLTTNEAKEIYENDLVLSLNNHPNPFNDRTHIRYIVPEDGLVELTILGASGKKIKILVNEYKRKGEYTALFESGDLISGIYFAQLSVNKIGIIKKINILK